MIIDAVLKLIANSKHAKKEMDRIGHVLGKENCLLIRDALEREMAGKTKKGDPRVMMLE